MDRPDLRTALAIGWLVRQLAVLTHRTEVQVAADLFDFLDRFDAERARRDATHGS